MKPKGIAKQKKEFEARVWRIAKKMHLENHIVDICWFKQRKPDKKGIITTGVATFSYVLYFNELEVFEMLNLSKNELIAHELCHFLGNNRMYEGDKGHDSEFFKDFKFWFKKLKNIK
jgi:predicted SprT family Zn-dependent metalloprotease